MQEYPKSPCIYHATQNITNFCKEKSCLMPLCPTCICTHMEMHIKEGKSNPKFDNITQSFISASTEIRKFNDKFDTNRGQLINVQKLILDQKKTLSDLVYQIKSQVRQIVQASFDELEKQLIAGIDKQNETLGLHLPSSLENLEKGIEDVSGKLREMLVDLKTDRGLSTLITFNHQTRSNIEKYQNVIANQIKNNEEYEPVLHVNYAAINRIKQSLSQVITLTFNLPEEMKKPTKVYTQASQTTAPTPFTSSINTIPNQILSHRGPAPKLPFSKTCLNSLRSSFGGNKETIPNYQTKPNATINQIQPGLVKRNIEATYVQNQPKQRAPVDIRRLEIENRY